MAAPGTTADAATLKNAASSFMAGLDRASESLTRHASRPRPISAPSLVDGGGLCGYEDEDSAPTCGRNESGGGGGSGGDYPGSGDWIGVFGTGATSTGCVVTPYGYLCTGKREQPDPWGSPVQPSSPARPVDWSAPWFPQSWCNRAPVLCSAGQEPDNDRGIDSSTSGKTKEQLYAICEAIAAVEYDVCNANGTGMDSRMRRACKEKVTVRQTDCYTTARELTDNGKHVAP